MLIAGSGTILAGCIADKEGWNKTQIFMGLLMLITSVYIIGYIMSLYWAYLLVQRAYRDKQAVQQYLAQTKVR